MENNNFIFVVISVLFLIIVSNLTFLLSKKIKFPYTVLLIFIGLLLFPLSKIEFFNFIDSFKLTPNIVFFVFLPILLFETSYNINVKELSRSWITISSLSILGVLISSFFIGLVLYYIFNLAGFHIHILITLLFGAIISATDPIAVISVFKKLGAPKRLTLIFEGESLFNDGTSVALFMIILGIIIDGNNFGNGIFFIGLLSFLFMLFGGIIFGLITGFSISKLIGKINYNEEVEISIALISAYITFISVEFINQYLGIFNISGIIATVVSSIVIGNYGRYKMTPKSESHMSKFLSFFTFLANSIIFLLMGITLFSININYSALIVPTIITIIIVMLSRAISIYFSINWINHFNIEDKVNDDRQKLLFWGGVRGVIALIMVLMIPGIGDIGYDKILLFQEFIGWNYDFGIRDFLLFLTIGIIIFTTFINTPTISYIMKKMGVDKLYNYEKIEYEEWKIIANLKILKKLEKFYEDDFINKKEYKKVKEKYKKQINDTIELLNKNLKGNKESVNLFIKRLIFKYSLGIEKSYINKFYYNKKLDEKHYKYILSDIESNIFKIEKGLENKNNIGNLKNYSLFFIEKIQFFKEKYNDEDMYIIYRTNYELSKKVLKDLKKLPNDELGFDDEIIKNIYKYYENLLDLYKNKMQDLLDNNKENIKNLETNIINKYFLKLEKKLLKDLFQKELIPYKLYINMSEKIEKGLYKDVKED